MDTTGMRSLKYPAMERMSMGINPTPTQDASGRYTLRMDESKAGNHLASSPGAKSGNYTAALREVAREKGIPIGLAGGPAIRSLIKQYGGSPDKLARYLHTRDVKEQARILLRMTRGV